MKSKLYDIVFWILFIIMLAFFGFYLYLDRSDKSLYLFDCIWSNYTLMFVILSFNIVIQLVLRKQHDQKSDEEKSDKKFYIIWLVLFAVCFGGIVSGVAENIIEVSERTEVKIDLPDGNKAFIIEKPDDDTNRIVICQNYKFMVRVLGNISEEMFVNQEMIKNNQFSYQYNANKKRFTLKLDYDNLKQPYYWNEKKGEQPELWEYSYIFD